VRLKKINCKHLKPVYAPPVYCRGFTGATGATGPDGIGATGLSGQTGPTGVESGMFSKTETTIVPGGSTRTIVGVGTGNMATTATIIDGDQYLYTTGGFLVSTTTDRFQFIYNLSPATFFSMFRIDLDTQSIQRPFQLEILSTFLSTEVVISATLTVGSAQNLPNSVYLFNTNALTDSGPRTFDVQAGGGDVGSYLECNYGVLTKTY
jgi:hypothetical protein